MDWGQGLSIGGMAEQDIASFLSAKLSTEELLRAHERASAEIAKYYPEARAELTPYRGLGTAGMTNLQRAAETEARPVGEYQLRVPGLEEEMRRPETYQRPEFQFRFKEDPGYQFRTQQGLQALEGSAASRGQALSGATLKALQEYGQAAASDEYSRAYNRALGEYQYGTTMDYNQWVERQRQAEEARRLGLLNLQTGQQAQQQDVMNRYQRYYQPGAQQLAYGTDIAKTLADLIYGYGQTRAGLQTQKGDIKAAGWQATANAAIQQGQHLQDIGSMGGGSSSSAASYNPSNTVSNVGTGNTVYDLNYQPSQGATFGK